MRLTTTTSTTFLPLLASVLILLLASPSQTNAQAAPGGGAPPVANPLQYPVVVVGPSLTTVAGSTSAINLPFTQTFVTPLGTWAFPTPSAGSVGLGDIQGTVGKVKGGTA